MFSGNTDCYQPLEATYGLTRACLEVCAEFRNPVGIITKSPLIERDIDVLVRLKEVAHVSVGVSIPFWEVDKARAIEPFVATPQRRMRIVERLAARGIRVGVSVAPIIPGLNDEEMGDVLKAAKDFPTLNFILYHSGFRGFTPVRADETNAPSTSTFRRWREAGSLSGSLA